MASRCVSDLSATSVTSSWRSSADGQLGRTSRNSPRLTEISGSSVKVRNSRTIAPFGKIEASARLRSNHSPCRLRRSGGLTGLDAEVRFDRLTPCVRVSAFYGRASETATETRQVVGRSDSWPAKGCGNPSHPALTTVGRNLTPRQPNGPARGENRRVVRRQSARGRFTPLVKRSGKTQSGPAATSRN
jgi:hypothetical protein